MVVDDKGLAHKTCQVCVKKLNRRAWTHLLLNICWLFRELQKKPRSCRVSPGFEPASAGGSLPRNAALAQAYRVIPIKLRTLLICIGSKREGNITNTAGL
jgi:hypothetical protein